MTTAFILGLSLFSLCRAVEDEDKWYTVQSFDDVARWEELSEHRSAHKLETLTSQHLAYVNQTISFSFPFFGEQFRQIRVTTQGFISLNQFVIVDTQYIGPLMANFKPYPTNNPRQELWVLHTTEFSLVHWRNMYLFHQEELGEFDFQLQIYPSGDILLLYKSTPASLDEILSTEHVVTAGISGGAHQGPGQATRIAYNTIELDNLASNRSYLLQPYKTCVDQRTCGDCVRWSAVCKWCDTLQQCSSGLDSVSSRWNAAGCPNYASKYCTQPMGHTSITPFNFNQSSAYTSASWGPTSASPGVSSPNLVTTRPATTPEIQAATTMGNNVEQPAEKEDEVEGPTPGGDPGKSGQHMALSVVYIIVIVASSLSLIFVVAAFIIILWNKRRTKEHLARRPETNTLISPENGGHHHHTGRPPNGVTSPGDDAKLPTYEEILTL